MVKGKDADISQRDFGRFLSRCAPSETHTKGQRVASAVSQRRALVIAAITLLFALPSTAKAQVDLPVIAPNHAVIIKADNATRWKQGSYDVWHLRGNPTVSQGRRTATAAEAIVWVLYQGEGQPNQVMVYTEGGARVSDHGGSTLVDRDWFGRFETMVGIQVDTPPPTVDPRIKPAIFQRAQAAFRAPLEEAPIRLPPTGNTQSYPERQAATWQPPPVGLPPPGVGAPQPLPPPTFLPPPVAQPGVEFIPPPNSVSGPPIVQPQPGGPPVSGLPAGVVPPRRIRVFPRSNSARVQAQWIPSPTGSERIGIIDSGVNVVIEGIQIEGYPDIKTLDIATDRAVIWTGSNSVPDLSGEAAQQSNTPLELYMEGNIVFRQGDRVIYADRLYYNVNGRYGIVLEAEMLTPAPEFQGLIRLKADVLQQVDEHNFQAFGTAITSSRMGIPKYWLQSEQLAVTDQQAPVFDPRTGAPVIDPLTQQQKIDHRLVTSASNNFVYIAGIPVMYWPTISADMTEPALYIDRISVRSDNVFGFQALIDLNAYQLLGITPPDGTKWTVTNDFFSERGFALGTRYEYDRPQLFGINDPAKGFIDVWGLHDSGLDNLGRDRRAVPLEEDIRGRVLGRHRHWLTPSLEFTGEVGFISDRNFLEQYYETEWDEFKDQSTNIALKHYYEESSFSIMAGARLNDFFTETQWLPRADHYIIGHSLLFDRLTWFGHTQAAYADLEVADAPTNPVDAAKFTLLPWEADSEGARVITRQEIDLPLDVGPVRVVPYVLGEAGYWGEDLSGQDVSRLYGQAGVRTSLPIWKVDPLARSELFYLNGLAHKISLETEFLYADANENLSRFALYDQLDDNAQEQFRRRAFFDTFNMSFPAKFDPRSFALRSGMQGNVTGAVAEIADDLTLFRVGAHQRWQTKRGLPGRERVVDWMTLDVDLSLFPEADRDNFGESVGMIDYDYRWHVGDRVTILSDGFFDAFDDGLRTFSIGGVLTRPAYSELYLGYRSIEGPISSNILTGSVKYHASDKWILAAGASVDLGPTGNIGQNFSIIRVGESALMRLGFTIDSSRDNFGIQFAIEPRFLSRSSLARIGGTQIPVAGARGLD